MTKFSFWGGVSLVFKLCEKGLMRIIEDGKAFAE